MLERWQWLGLRQRQGAGLGVQGGRHKRAVALACGIQVPQKRCMYHTDGGFSVVHEPDRNTHKGESLDKVGRAVNGIDNPGRRVRNLSTLTSCPALFTDKLVVRVLFADRMAHELLRVLVRLRDQVRRVLLFVKARCVWVA